MKTYKRWGSLAMRDLNDTGETAEHRARLIVDVITCKIRKNRTVCFL
jgi:hypothetical protein